MDALNRGRNSLIAATGLVLFAVLYYTLVYRYGLNLADEGNVALISQRLMHGERPFREVITGYNVLWFYPISALFRIFSSNLLYMREYFYAISTGSALIAFFLLRRLDAPLWLAFVQGLMVISINGQYYNAYIPFLVVANLFAITLFLTSQRKVLASLGAGILLGTTYLIRIDIGIFYTVVWLFVILLHAILLNRRVRVNLMAAGYLAMGVVVMHLPFLYDAYHRRFLPGFLDQYLNVAAMIASPIATHWQLFAGENRSSPQPPATVQPGAGAPKSGATAGRAPSLLRRLRLQDIFSKSPSLEKRLLALLTYVPALLICLLGITGLYLALVKRIAPDRWLIFSALLAGCLSAFPQFFFFRPDLAHLIEFMNGGLVAITCAGWVLWSSQGNARSSIFFAAAIAITEMVYVCLAFVSPYGGTILVRVDRTMEFRGSNGVDVFLNRAEYDEVDSLFKATVLNSSKKDYVACYPYLPGVNFIAARPTFQSSLYVDDMAHPADWEQTEIARIKKYRPAVIIIDDWKVNGSEQSRFTHWASQLTKFVESNYRSVGVVSGKTVFARLTPTL
jgi:hypothetical protein